MKILAHLMLFTIICLGPVACGEASDAGSGQLADVTLEAGYETDRRDGGRPVALIAAALEVKPKVFRDAFSKVTPARNGKPSKEHAQRNKKILMDALAKHGVTNKRLDEVSNFYRYRPGDGRLWEHTPAKIKAIIQDGKVTGFEVVQAGAGYLSPPIVKVEGFEDVHAVAKIEFTKDLKTNGRIASVSIVTEEEKAPAAPEQPAD